MKVNIRGEKIKITAPIKEYIEKKITKLDKYLERAEEIEAYVLVKIKGKEQVIEVTIPTKKYTLRAEESHSDLYAASDLVIDKLERQIRKNKTRLKDKYKNYEEDEFVLNFEEKEENTNKIVRRKDVESKPMDEQEAILQMDLIGHDFFVFKNEDEEYVSVLYTRKDGSYGILNVK